MARELLSARGLEVQLRHAVEEAAARNTRIKIRDGANLMLIVRPTGGSTWIFQYRHGGQRKPLTLGAWPDVSLRLARELAHDARVLLVRGIDPNVKKKEDRIRKEAAQAAATYTVLRLFEDWMAKRITSEVYGDNIRAAFVKDVLPDIGHLPPTAVTRQHILAILRKAESRGALVLLRRLRMWIKQMYEFALDADVVTTSPVPTGQLKSFMQPTQGHFPAITNAADVAPLMRAIRGYDHTIVRTALLLSAHLFQRPSEIRQATVEEFDLAQGRWKIPAHRMKKKREHWVPLSIQVVELLRSHFGVIGEEGSLFRGRSYGGVISDNTLNMALDRMGYKGKHTAHGFRAMARTVLEEHLGVDDRYLEKQLAHEDENKTRRAYNRAEYWTERVALMQRWSDWLDEQR
jgi:integrase